MAQSRIQTYAIHDFSGGWNPRDAFSDLAPNESPDCLNVTLNERGGVEKRLGQSRLGSGTTTNSASIYQYSQTLDLFFTQDGTTLKKTTDHTTFTNVHVFSTSARVAITDFQSYIIGVHPIDGVFKYDGTTYTAVDTGIKGTCCTTWQNKVWVGGDPALPYRLQWCVAGDPTKWNTPSGTTHTGVPATDIDYNDIREGDNASEAIVAIGAGQGMDVQGRPTLLVFKRRSYHRVNNATTGAYTTLSTTAGAAGPLAVTSLNGAICSVDQTGIWRTDGVSPPVNVAERLQPLFTPTQLSVANQDLWAAGWYSDRMVFSLSRTGSSTNNLVLEYHPVIGWIVPHAMNVADFAQYTKNTNLLYSASSANGKYFNTFAGGADDGVSITARYQSRWFELTAGHLCRWRRMIVSGRGQFQLFARFDYTTGVGNAKQVQIIGTGSPWGTFVWGVDPWGQLLYEGYQSFYSIGVSRSLSFVFTHSGTTSATGPKLLTDGASPEVGAFACYGIDLDYVALGVA